jgi:prepilin-type processing-associated H-X9-DG protein
MTWGATSSVRDRSNTNHAWVLNGALGKYTAGAVGAYRCPADNYLSSAQRTAGFKQRNRSLSMNSLFGRFRSIPDGDPTATGVSWGLTDYMQYLKQSSVPRPAKTWLLIDEQADSINDGYFINNPQVMEWQDIPASYHNGACGFSFADGHSEIKKWRSGTSNYKVQYNPSPPRMTFDAPGRLDFNWYLERTGFVLKASGQPRFGY